MPNGCHGPSLPRPASPHRAQRGPPRALDTQSRHPGGRPLQHHKHAIPSQRLLHHLPRHQPLRSQHLLLLPAYKPHPHARLPPPTRLIPARAPKRLATPLDPPQPAPLRFAGAPPPHPPRVPPRRSQPHRQCAHRARRSHQHDGHQREPAY